MDDIEFQAKDEVVHIVSKRRLTELEKRLHISRRRHNHRYLVWLWILN